MQIKPSVKCRKTAILGGFLTKLVRVGRLKLPASCSQIQLLDKPTIYWDFHSLLLGIQMMFSFMPADDEQPLRLCKRCV